MKANIENLKKALQVCAKAHNAEFCDWSDEGQLAIHSDTVSVVNDVKMIAESFFGGNADVETDWGYVNVWLSDEYLDDVDEVKLSLAMPYGEIEKLNK